ncbi:MAG: 6-phosphogluconate dehydrogenase [Acidobacteria bacterium]|nr:MAG: 6-phosphogluconate dehydrogenase [Acidobacteriota bacterium]
MKIGFVGLGSMGSCMARRLIDAGHALTVYNRTPSRAEPFRAWGARVADSVSEAATGADVLISMVADDSALEALVFPPGDALRALPACAVHASMSTISVALSRRLADAHAERRQHYVAAPVFGRPEAAAAGKLFVVAAGPNDQVHRCEPIFDALGQKTFNIGLDASAANVIKLAGNFLISTVIESLAECLALARKHGIDSHTLLDVLTGTLFSAPIYRTYGTILVDQRFDPPGFALPLGMKDNALVLAAAQAAHVPMPMASLVRDQFLAAMAAGLANADWSAIARITFRNAGL